ncbi:pilus assembly protein PilV [Vibrio sp. S17_S38]|uniref:type IV pilus modification PilV family protein n=1 Tax=Vibrio sp. S17_S38 TaxID=2720229 RepID=UPI0016811444|nr:prepilin-type N-terminal cleavage/methylation domain-containing protein [Vibrio sp. S17_S38]MBD1571828.1 pilus assembly protein PilV [Vibrio sp. S17_S38]
MTSKQQGFSLLEVMIAFAVLVFGVLGLMKLQSYMERQSDYALHSIRALHLAEAKLELFRTRSISGASGTIKFDDIQSGCEMVSGTHSVSFAVSGGSCNLVAGDPDYLVRWSAPLVVLSGSLKTIEVTSSWNDRRNELQSLQLKTMLSKYNEFDN